MLEGSGVPGSPGVVLPGDLSHACTINSPLQWMYTRGGKTASEPTSQPELFQLYEEEPDGSRPPCLGEPREPQGRILPHAMEQLADVVPMVQVLDFPVVLGGIG